MEEPEGQTALWITHLSEYELYIEHNKRHRNAYGVSGIPWLHCGNEDNIIATCAVNMPFWYS